MELKRINSIMNYEKIYHSIIEKAKTRILTEYFEEHHIIPKSLGGNNSKENKAILTAREHFVCHWLLWKFSKGKDKIKMGHAFGMMRYHSSTNRYYTSIGYEIARKAHSLSASLHHKGKILSDEEMKRMKENNPNAKEIEINGIKYKSRKEAWEKLNTTKRRLYFFLNGKINFEQMMHQGRYPLSEETKKKIGAWSKGKTYEELLGKEKSLLLKEKRKNFKLNKKLSQETKNKISAAHLKRNNNE